MRTADREAVPAAPGREFPAVFEDEQLLAIDKPAGVAVHGGSGESFGVIEQLRRARPRAEFLELVHRLDKETSGLLLVAKTRKRPGCAAERPALEESGAGLRQDLCGAGCRRWPEKLKVIDVALHKYLDAEGTRRVRTVAAESAEGRRSITLVRVAERFAAEPGFSLLDVTIKTGRTHQIRVHLADAGHVVVGDREVRRLRPQQGAGARQRASRHPLRAHVPPRPSSFLRASRKRRAGRARGAPARGLRPAAAGAPIRGRAAMTAPLRSGRVRLGRHPVRLDPADRPLHPGRLRRRRHRGAERSRRKLRDRPRPRRRLAPRCARAGAGSLRRARRALSAPLPRQPGRHRPVRRHAGDAGRAEGAQPRPRGGHRQEPARPRRRPAPRGAWRLLRRYPHRRRDREQARSADAARADARARQRRPSAL